MDQKRIAELEAENAGFRERWEKLALAIETRHELVRGQGEAGAAYRVAMRFMQQLEAPATEEGKADLVQFAGTWKGEDFEECLKAVKDKDQG